MEEKLAGSATGSVAEMLQELHLDMEAANGHLATVREDAKVVADALGIACACYDRLREASIEGNPNFESLGEVLDGIRDFVSSGEMTEAVEKLQQAQQMAAARYSALAMKVEWPRNRGRSPDKANPTAKTFRQYLMEAFLENPNSTKREIFERAKENCGGTVFLEWDTVRKHFKKIIPKWVPKQTSAGGGPKRA
jgi:hypothetical protein